MRVCFCYGHKNHKSDSCCYSDAQCCQGNGFRHLAYTGKGGEGGKGKEVFCRPIGTSFLD